MRRGRPTKSTPPPPVNDASSPPLDHQSTAAFDPFDPSQVDKKISSPPLSSSAFLNSFTPESQRDSFQNSFVPEPKRSSFQKIFVPQSSPKRDTSYSYCVPETKEYELATSELKVTHHSTPQPQIATIVDSAKVEVENQPILDKQQVEEEEEDKMPTINRGVSSSIEERFMAIKNASKSKPLLNKKTKPAPPPKPARLKTHRSEQNVPSVDDFEHKFPTLEELNKSLI